MTAFAGLPIPLQWYPHDGPHGPHGPAGPGGPMGPGGGAPGWMPYHDAGLLGAAWPFLWLLLAAAVVLAVAYLAIRVLGDGERATDADGALAVLRRRYARGEIDADEFEERAGRLTRDSDTGT